MVSYFVETVSLEEMKAGLNPCCSGQWSRTRSSEFNGDISNCLNPCCSGQWSRTL